jgi:hypothetical protein
MTMTWEDFRLEPGLIAAERMTSETITPFEASGYLPNRQCIWLPPRSSVLARPARVYDGCCGKTTEAKHNSGDFQ